MNLKLGLLARIPQFFKVAGFGVLLAICSTSNPALAEQWIYVGTADNDTEHFLDFDSIRGSGSTRNFWVRVEDTSGRAVALSKLVVNCAGRQGGFLESIEYSRFGGGYPRRSENPYPRMQEIAPGTMFSAYADYLCSRITANSTPAPTIQPTVAPSGSRATCGDPAPSRSGSHRIYPVFAAFSQTTLQYIHTNLCRDAFLMTRENGQRAIQVASFTDESRASEFARSLRSRIGSGEVGEASTLVRP